MSTRTHILVTVLLLLALAIGGVEYWYYHDPLRQKMASLTEMQEQSDKAEAEDRVTLAALERQLGPDHPDTLATRYKLAEALQKQGDAVAAKEAHRAQMEPDHHYCIPGPEDLAVQRKVQGKYAKAEVEYRAVLAARERVLGPEHPDTSRSHYDLALCLRKQSKLEEAKREATAAYAGWRKSLGDGDSCTRDALGLLYKMEGWK